MSSRVVKQMYLSLIEYSMLFIHKQSRFVCDSGGMSATVGVAPISKCCRSVKNAN